MEQTKGQELFRSIDRVRRAWISVTPGETLTKSQFGTLMVISKHEKQSQTPIHLSELAEIMHQSLPALSQRMRVLENMGYIIRVPDPRDRRVTGVHLSDTGRKTLEMAAERFGSILSQALERLGTEAADQLILLLGQLAEALEGETEA